MLARRTLGIAALALGAALLSAPPAGAGEGFLGRCPLFPVLGAGQDGATGGVTAWFRQRNDRSTVQGLRVWVRGLVDAEGAALWVTPPGLTDAQEVGDLALAQDSDGELTGSGYFEVIVDSRFDDGSEIPAGLESMVKLASARIEVRTTDADAVETASLQGRIPEFRFRDIVLRPGSPGTSGRTVRMVRPPEPVVPPDDVARGSVRIWRRPQAGGARMGLAIYARFLTADESYEVWLEDPAGELQEVGALDSTADGLGYWSVDTATGETLPPEAGEDDVRGLRGRRIEIRRSGVTDPSLIAILPRVR